LTSLVRANWFFYDTFLPRLYEKFDWGDEYREDGDPKADHELDDLFNFIKTIAESPCLASHVISARLTDWNFGEDEVDRVTINQGNALVLDRGDVYWLKPASTGLRLLAISV
jgi:hypothetical protein